MPKRTVYDSGIYVNPIALAAAFSPIVIVVVLFLLMVYAPTVILGVFVGLMAIAMLYLLINLGISIYEEVDDNGY